MTKKLILHFCSSSPITKSYIEFVNSEFDPDEHYFIIFETSFKYEYPSNAYSITSRNSKVAYFKLIQQLFKCNKLILHGFFPNSYITRLLTIFPMMTKKTIWVPWGGDFYDDLETIHYTKLLKYKIFFYFKKRILKKIPYYATNTTGDYILAKQFYGSQAKHIKCIMYPSNLFKESIKRSTLHKEMSLNILLGNSASYANNHRNCFNKLANLDLNNTKIYCPLSYGEREYAESISQYGYKMFGTQFIPLLDLMEINDYYNFLNSIDIAFFNHNRQEAMGNIVTLLSLGKKVYMNPNTLYNEFISIGIKLFDINSTIELAHLENTVAAKNTSILKNYFNKENLILQTKTLFQST